MIKIKNMIEFIRNKYVGLDLHNGKVKAFEIKDDIYIDKSIQEIYPNILKDIDEDNDSYWYDLDIMRKLLIYVSKNTKKSLFRHKLYIAIPFEISESKDKRLIVDAALQSKWRSVYMINNFLCSAVGSGIGINEIKRKIYVYYSQNKIYIGLIFAGGAFNVKILEKDYNQLIEMDIINKIEELLKESSSELPEQFTGIKLLKKDLDKISKGWKLEVERKIYLSVPPNFKNKFHLNIGKYELVYLDYENNILNGLKKTIKGLKKLRYH